MTPLIPATAPDEGSIQPAAEEQVVPRVAGAAEATVPHVPDAEEPRVPSTAGSTTGSTPVTNSTNDDPPADPGTEEPDAGVEKKKIAPIWIAVTLSVGLLIAVIYLGARIISAHRTARPAPAIAAVAIAPPVQKPVEPPVETRVVPEHSPAPQQVISGTDSQPAITPSPSPLTITPRTDAQVSSGKDPLPAITPQPGQRYLQVGALDYSEATRRFIERLRGENLDPKVAPGPSPQLLRVLIGPFDNRDALQEKKAQIEAEGLDTFVRQY